MSLILLDCTQVINSFQRNEFVDRIQTVCTIRSNDTRYQISEPGRNEEYQLQVTPKILENCPHTATHPATAIMLSEPHRNVVGRCMVERVRLYIWPKACAFVEGVRKYPL
jgi:hypothetical protein